MRHFIIPAMLVLLAVTPAQAQRPDEPIPNPTCETKVRVCPDGSYMTSAGVDCTIPPCGGYPPPRDPYAPPPGSTGHYTVPPQLLKPATTPVAPVNTCNKEFFTCPDGTTVTRVPPMCNFARCPVSADPVEEQEDTPPEEPQEENPDDPPAQ